VFIGNGAVVCAILQYMVRYFESFPDTFVMRRSPMHDPTLKALVPASFPLHIHNLEPDNLEKILNYRSGETLLVQASSAPLLGDDLAYLAPAISNFHGVVMDLTYGKTSAIYEAAVAKGLPCQDGLPMLIEQARLAQNYWWGKSADYDALARMLGVTINQAHADDI